MFEEESTRGGCMKLLASLLSIICVSICEFEYKGGDFSFPDVGTVFLWKVESGCNSQGSLEVVKPLPSHLKRKSQTQQFKSMNFNTPPGSNLTEI